MGLIKIPKRVHHTTQKSYIHPEIELDLSQNSPVLLEYFGGSKNVQTYSNPRIGAFQETIFFRQRNNLLLDHIIAFYPLNELGLHNILRLDSSKQYIFERIGRIFSGTEDQLSQILTREWPGFRIYEQNLRCYIHQIKKL